MDKFKQRAKIAKMKATGAKAWFQKHLAFSITLAVVIVLFVGSLIFVAVYYRDKAAPGTTVASAKVGGQTVDQATETLNNMVKNMRLSLTYGGKSATASASDLGINIDTQKYAKEAVQTGQGNPFGVVFNHRHFDLTGSYDKTKVQEFITHNFPELTTAPKDAQINYDPDQTRYVMQPGAIGKSVKLPELYATVEKLLEQPGLTSYEIATNDDKPIVSNESAQATTDQVNSVLSKAIQITNGGKVLWTVDPWDEAKWITFATNKDTGKYDVNIDKAKINGFVKDTVTKQLPNKPVNQVAITDGNNQVLQVIKPGQDGQTASNVDDVANQIYQALANDQALSVEMTTQHAPFGTDAKVAKDGRWVEANLSTYEVKAHQGNQVVWSTSDTSNGKSASPTITGVYTVWHKNFVQCMPNDPSPEPLCGIHYVTYWEKSGYAFHEAWWITQSGVSGDLQTGPDPNKIHKGISHGCINMVTKDAKYIYDFTSIGTPVWVHY